MGGGGAAGVGSVDSNFTAGWRRAWACERCLIALNCATIFSPQTSVFRPLTRWGLGMKRGGGALRSFEPSMGDKFPLKKKQSMCVFKCVMSGGCMSSVLVVFFLFWGNSQKCISVSSRNGLWGGKEINYSYKCNYHNIKMHEKRNFVVEKKEKKKLLRTRILQSNPLCLLISPSFLS